MFDLPEEASQHGNNLVSTPDCFAHCWKITPILERLTTRADDWICLPAREHLTQFVVDLAQAAPSERLNAHALSHPFVRDLFFSQPTFNGSISHYSKKSTSCRVTELDGGLLKKKRHPSPFGPVTVMQRSISSSEWLSRNGKLKAFFSLRLT
jgi:hypothetical protein